MINYGSSNITGMPVSEQVDGKALRRVVFSAAVGNAFEWFDFMVFGFFSAYVVAAYFPMDSSFGSSLLAASAFSVAFFFRPVGGILFGMFADRSGRRPALAMMIGLMGIATLVIGATPDYAILGFAAPVVVVIARMVQGVSVGGEFAGSTSLLVEVAPTGRKMLFGSLQSSTQALAVAAAALLGYGLADRMSPEALSEWGWRVPFLVGALVAPLAYYIRRNVAESPVYSKPVAPTSLARLLSGNVRPLFAAFGVVVVTTASNYTWVIYMPTFVVQQLGLSFTDSLFGMIVCGIVVAVFCPIAGWLADRVGPYKVFVAGVVSFTAITWPLLAYVLAQPSLERLLVSQLCVSATASLCWGASPGILVGMFRPAIRSTGIAISHNLGVLAFGGLAPLTLTMLVGVTGNLMMPAYYLTFSAAIALAALYVGRRKAKKTGTASTRSKSRTKRVPGKVSAH